VAAQATFPVAYKGKHIGTYAADLVVDGRLLVEIKCADQLSNEHLAQCINYLKASGLHPALPINSHAKRLPRERLRSSRDSVIWRQGTVDGGGGQRSTRLMEA
jgi:GxxExxY protein